MTKNVFLMGCLMLMLMLLAGGAHSVLANKVSQPSFELVFDAESDTAGIFAVQEFKSSLYLALSDEVNGGQVLVSADGTSWQPATQPGFGFGPEYKTSYDMTEFKGELYVLANCYWEGYWIEYPASCPNMVLRTPNGKDWTSFPFDTGSSYLDKVGVFQDMIYVTSVGWEGGSIWRSLTGNPGTWELVKTLDAGIWSSSSPVAFKNHVYLSIHNGTEPESVGILHSADGLHWETSTLTITSREVVAGDYVTDGMLLVYQDALYQTVVNNIDGGAIYRTTDGQNWEKVIFGDLDVKGFKSLVQYKGNLYATAFYLTFYPFSYGTQLWRSPSGNPGSWEKVSPDPTVWGEFVADQRGMMAVLNGNLYIGDQFANLFRMNTD